MNFLAHLLLAEDDSGHMVGSLAADFFRGETLSDFEPQVQAGILLHRTIDSFTDTHPIHCRSRTMLVGCPRHFSGVLVDIFYDHFLALHWHRYAHPTLGEFSETAYRRLLGFPGAVPSRMRSYVERMAQYDLLSSYAIHANLEAILAGISRRFSGKVDLREAYPIFLSCYQGLETDFSAFFPELLEYVGKLQFNRPWWRR